MTLQKSIIYTIGHSTRSIDELIELLRTHGVRRLIDVRTIAKSRHNPQFNRRELSKSLHNRRLNYRHLISLGGLRHARSDSQNDGWRNKSFRGYADYMQSREFERGLEQLIALAGEKTAAIMCAEAVPWRCHRSLIADALLVRGFQVLDIMSLTSTKPHKLTPFAKVEGTTITYPASTSTSQLKD